MAARIRLLLLVVGMVAIVGCGAVSEARKAAERAQMMNNLKIVGLNYHAFYDENNVGPANWDELISVAEKNGQGADEIQAVKDAGYQVKWGVAFKDLTQGLSNTEMAVNPAGGPVLMFDGAVK